MDQKVWHDDLLVEFFDEDDKDHIRRMLISSRLSLDKLIWHYSDREIFTMQNAYWVAWDCVKPLLVSASSSNTGGGPFSPLWKAIWKAKVPPKVRNMVWRTCQNILSTKSNLS